MDHRHLYGRAAFADPVTVPKGMSVPVTLQQHVTSGYVMVESDVSIGGQVVIRKGTHVVGKDGRVPRSRPGRQERVDGHGCEVA